MMAWHRIYTFVKQLEVIESSLYLLGAHDDELRMLGLGHVLRRIDSKELVGALDSFSENLETCIKVAPHIDKSIAERLTTLLADSKIEDLMAQLAVRVKLAELEVKKPVAQSIKSFAYMFFHVLYTSVGKSFPFFIDKSVSLENVISAVTRLKVLVKILSDEQLRRTSNDDEIFKPSNVDITIILTCIDQAIYHLDASQAIRPDEKERLTKYLQEINAELAKDAPAWKKIVGALIICATLLSGLADAPQALKNINNAIQHILGTSVQKSLPSLLPPENPPSIKEDGKDVRKAIST